MNWTVVAFSLFHFAWNYLLQGTRVNGKPKGVAAPVLAPTKNAQGEVTAKVIPDASGQDPAVTNVVDAASSSGGSGEKDVTAAAGRNQTTNKAGEVDYLCAAVKRAWTDEVGVVAADDGKEQSGGVGEEIEKEGGVEEDSDGASGEDDGVEEEGATEEDAEESSDDVDDVGDDDEWEPEENNAGGGKSTAAAAVTTTAATAPFSADDFPTLGGGNAHVAPASAAAATSAPTPSAEAEVAAAAAPTEACASSWSHMARSNPAPFKVPAKADPAPLPAAAPSAAATSPLIDAGGMFSTSGASAAADGPRPDGAKVGTSRILSTAAGFGVSGGGAEDDDGEGWVTPSNIKSQKAVGIGLNGPSQSQAKGRHGGQGAIGAVASKCRAGCVTTDFAMQNVILQVGAWFELWGGLGGAEARIFAVVCTQELDERFCLELALCEGLFSFFVR